MAHVNKYVSKYTSHTFRPYSLDNRKRKFDQARIASEKASPEELKIVRALLKQGDESTIVESLVDRLEMASPEEVHVLKRFLNTRLTALSLSCIAFDVTNPF